MSDSKLACPKCGQTEMVIKNGKSGENQKFKCKTCNLNYIDNGTEDDNIEIKKQLSDIPKYANFRKNYGEEFPQPKYSEKYDFEFSSWKEYYSKRAKAKRKTGE